MNTRENLLGFPAGAEWVLSQLMTVVKTGISTLHLGTPAADTLAAAIAALFAENELLKKLVDSRVTVDATAENYVKISFGPGNQYVLHLPVTSDEDRRAVGAALSYAGAKILYELENKDDAKQG